MQGCGTLFVPHYGLPFLFSGTVLLFKASLLKFEETDWAFVHSFLHHWSRCTGHSSHQMESQAWGIDKSKSTSKMVITNGEFKAFFFCTDGDGMTNSYVGLVRLRWEHCRPSIIFWLWQSRWLCLVVTVGISAFYSFNYGGCIGWMVKWTQIDRESFFYKPFHTLFSTFLS